MGISRLRAELALNDEAWHPGKAWAFLARAGQEVLPCSTPLAVLADQRAVPGAAGERHRLP